MSQGRLNDQEAALGSETTCGVTYLAFGAPYLAMTLVSAASLRATNPAVPIHIVTNVRSAAPHLDWWRASGGDSWEALNTATITNRAVKSDIDRHSPFEKTLYLDCDTMVVGSLTPLWRFLNHFDVVLRLVRDPCREDGGRPVLYDDLLFREVSHFNSGVIGFRKNDRTRHFFSEWKRRFEAMTYHRDQPALIEALFTTEVRLLPLRDRWNQGDFWRLSPARRRDVVIWHYKTRSWDARLRAWVRRAPDWFDADASERAEVEEFIADREGWQKREPLREAGKSFLREARGPLSRHPELAAGKARWAEWMGGERAPPR